MVRIPPFVRLPLALQGAELCGKTRAVALRTVAPARLGLVVDERRARFIEGGPTAILQLHAKIDVVECDTELMLVESTHRVELFARDDKAGRSHCADALWKASTLEVARIVG